MQKACWDYVFQSNRGCVPELLRGILMDMATTIFLYILIPSMTLLVIAPIVGYFILEAIRSHKRHEYLMSPEHIKWVALEERNRKRMEQNENE